MFLELDDNGDVRLRQGAMKIPSVYELYSSDKRSAEKPFFYKCIAIIYHLYKREHDFGNLGVKERQDKVELIYCPDKDIKKILENTKVQSVIEDFKTLEYTSTQRLFEGIKNSMEHWKHYMSKIPMTKIVKYEAWHDVHVIIDNKPEIRNVLVKDMIEIDNSEEYIKAMKRAEEMIDLEERMYKKVLKESQLMQINGEDSMLEAGNFADLIKFKTDHKN